MTSLDQSLASWIVALGIGLLIGAERERRKGEGPQREPAGIRTFSIAALLGAVSLRVGGPLLLSIATAGIIAFAAISYYRSRSDDPGLTTEIALVLTLALGGLAMQEPQTAAALAVITAILLAARAPLQSFVRDVLTQSELKSALIFAAATLVVWPVLPDRYLGPLQAINPRSIWSLVIFIMAISAAGYVAVRLLGSKHGLPLAGFASGFVSSSATIASMGTRATDDPRLVDPAVAGAVLSTVATVVQVALLVGATSQTTLAVVATPLLCAGVTAVAYGLFFSLRLANTAFEGAAAPGEAFSVKTALILAATLAVVLLLSAVLQAWLGDGGLTLAVGMAAFADAHAPVASVASQVAAGRLAATDAAVPILLALTTNSATKIILAFGGGSRPFAWRVATGVILVLVAAWAGHALR